MPRPDLGARAYSTRFRHVSSEPIIGPVAGEDPHFDEGILRGDLVLIGHGTLRDGTRVRFCRTKGKTYRSYPKVIGRDRREHRAAERA